VTYQKDMIFLGSLLDTAEFSTCWTRHATDLNVADVVADFHRQGPYTVCVIYYSPMVRTKRSGIYVGAAKRCTYGPRSDEENQERGRVIAFSRALQNMIAYFGSVTDA
jgi:hypothetical protein